MHARDICAGSQNEERNDRRKLSQRSAPQQLPTAHVHEPPRGCAADLSKGEVVGSRPCGVTLRAPPEAHTLRREPWSMPEHDAYRYTAAAQAPTTEHLYPQRNISPRQTYQENMRRILVPPRSDMSKIVTETSAPLVNFPLQTDESISKNIKMNSAVEPKYCDVPYFTNPLLKQQRGSAVRNSDVYMGASMRGWSASSAYYPPEYCVPHSTKPPLEKSAESVQPFGGSVNRSAPVRYEPYPNPKEKYPRARYEYVNFPNSYQPYLPTPHKYDSTKPVAPPTFVNYTPQKYVDPRIVDPHPETYSRPAQTIRGLNTAQTGDYIAAKFMVPNSHYPLQNKIYGYPMHLPTAMKSPYDAGRSYYEYDYSRIKPLQVSDNPYMSEIPAYAPRPQFPIHNYPINNAHPKHTNYFYHQRNDNIAMKAYPEHLTQYKCADLRQNTVQNPLARIPAQFSPNIISPAESNTSTESAPALGTQHEDCGYASQGSTASGKSFDFPHYKMHQYDHSVNDSRAFASLHGSHVKNPREYFQSNEYTSLKDNKNINVRQFLQSWDEHDEDEVTKSKDASNTGEPVASITIEAAATPAGQQQLYVLDLVNIPSEEIDKYGHIQKVCKLPENIRGYDSADLLNKFDEAFHPSPSISYNTNNIHPELNSHQNSMIHSARPPTPFDVEAKITQSVIHKDVGCNFEIKPCSPPVKSLEVASAIQPDERKIEKIVNQHIVQPITSIEPILDTGVDVEDEKNVLKYGEKRKSLSDDSEMLNSKIMKTVESQCRFNSDNSDHGANGKDYGTVSGECLASLPRLDNDMEYFTEINQQYSDSKINQETVIISATNNTSITLHDDTNKNLQWSKLSPKNENEFHLKEHSFFCDSQVNSFPIEDTSNVNNSRKLSQFRKIKTPLLKENNIETSIKSVPIIDSSQQKSPVQRIDSVIIKNPDSLEHTMSILEECVKSPQCVTQPLPAMENKKNSKNKSVWAHSFTNKIKETDFIDPKKSNAQCDISNPINEMFSLPGSSPINLIMHGPSEDYTDCIRPSLIHCINNESSNITDKEQSDRSKPDLNEIPISVAINLSIHSNQLDLYPSSTDRYELHETCKDPSFTPKCKEIYPDDDVKKFKTKEESNGTNTGIGDEPNNFLDGENNDDKSKITLSQSTKSNCAIQLCEVKNDVDKQDLDSIRIEMNQNHDNQESSTFLDLEGTNGSPVINPPSPFTGTINNDKESPPNYEKQANLTGLEQLNKLIVPTADTEVVTEETLLNDNDFEVDVDDHIEENIENIALHIMSTGNIFTNSNTKDTSLNESIPMPANNDNSLQTTNLQGLLCESFSNNALCIANQSIKSCDEEIIDKVNTSGISKTIENKDIIQSDCPNSIVQNYMRCESFNFKGYNYDDQTNQNSNKTDEIALVTQSTNIFTNDCDKEQVASKVESEYLKNLNLNQRHNTKIGQSGLTKDCNDVISYHAENVESNFNNSPKCSLNLMTTGEVLNINKNVRSPKITDEVVVTSFKENQISELQNIAMHGAEDTFDLNAETKSDISKSLCSSKCDGFIESDAKQFCKNSNESSSYKMNLPMPKSGSFLNTTSEENLNAHSTNHTADNENTITNAIGTQNGGILKSNSIKETTTPDLVTIEDKELYPTSISQCSINTEIPCIVDVDCVEVKGGSIDNDMCNKCIDSDSPFNASSVRDGLKINPVINTCEGDKISERKFIYRDPIFASNTVVQNNTLEVSEDHMIGENVSLNEIVQENNLDVFEAHKISKNKSNCIDPNDSSTKVVQKNNLDVSEVQVSLSKNVLFTEVVQESNLDVFESYKVSGNKSICVDPKVSSDKVVNNQDVSESHRIRENVLSNEVVQVNTLVVSEVHKIIENKSLCRDPNVSSHKVLQNNNLDVSECHSVSGDISSNEVVQEITLDVSESYKISDIKSFCVDPKVSSDKVVQKNNLEVSEGHRISENISSNEVVHENNLDVSESHQISENKSFCEDPRISCDKVMQKNNLDVSEGHRKSKNVSCNDVVQVNTLDASESHKISKNKSICVNPNVSSNKLMQDNNIDGGLPVEENMQGGSNVDDQKFFDANHCNFEKKCFTDQINREEKERKSHHLELEKENYTNSDDNVLKDVVISSGMETIVHANASINNMKMFIAPVQESKISFNTTAEQYLNAHSPKHIINNENTITNVICVQNSGNDGPKTDSIEATTAQDLVMVKDKELHYTSIGHYSINKDNACVVEVDRVEVKKGCVDSDMVIESIESVSPSNNLSVQGGLKISPAVNVSESHKINENKSFSRDTLAFSKCYIIENVSSKTLVQENISDVSEGHKINENKFNCEDLNVLSKGSLHENTLDQGVPSNENIQFGSNGGEEMFFKITKPSDLEKTCCIDQVRRDRHYLYQEPKKGYDTKKVDNILKDEKITIENIKANTVLEDNPNTSLSPKNDNHVCEQEIEVTIHENLLKPDSSIDLEINVDNNFKEKVTGIFMETIEIVGTNAVLQDSNQFTDHPPNTDNHICEQEIEITINDNLLKPDSSIYLETNVDNNLKNKVIGIVTETIENIDTIAVLEDSNHNTGDLPNSDNHICEQSAIIENLLKPDSSKDLEWKHTTSNHSSKNASIYLNMQQNMCTFDEIESVEAFLCHSSPKEIYKEVINEKNDVQCNSLCEDIMDQPFKTSFMQEKPFEAIISGNCKKFVDNALQSDLECGLMKVPIKNLLNTSEDVYEHSIQQNLGISNNIDTVCSSDMKANRMGNIKTAVIHKENFAIHSDTKEKRHFRGDFLSSGNKDISMDKKKIDVSGNDEFECCTIKAFDSESVLMIDNAVLNTLINSEEKIESNNNLDNSSIPGRQNYQESISTPCLNSVTEDKIKTHNINVRKPLFKTTDHHRTDSTILYRQKVKLISFSENVVHKSKVTNFLKEVNISDTKVDKITNKNAQVDVYFETQNKPIEEIRTNCNENVNPSLISSEKFGNDYKMDAIAIPTSSDSTSLCIAPITSVNSNANKNNEFCHEKIKNIDYQKTNNFLELEYDHKEPTPAQDASQKNQNSVNCIYMQDLPKSEGIGVKKIMEGVILDKHFEKINQCSKNNINTCSADNFISSQMSLINRKNRDSRWDKKIEKKSEQIVGNNSSTENKPESKTGSVIKTIMENKNIGAESNTSFTDVANSDSMELSSHLSFIFENLSKKRRLSNKGLKVSESNSTKCTGSHIPRKLSTRANHENNLNLSTLNSNIISKTNSASVSKIAKLFFDDKETETQKLRKLLLSDENIQRNINSEKYLAKWRNMDNDIVQQNILGEITSDAHIQKGDVDKSFKESSLLPELQNVSLLGLDKTVFYDTACSKETPTQTTFSSKKTSKTDILEKDCKNKFDKCQNTKDSTDGKYSDTSSLSKKNPVDYCSNNLKLYDELWSEMEVSMQPTIGISHSGYEKDIEVEISNDTGYDAGLNDYKSENTSKEVNLMCDDIKTDGIKLGHTPTCVDESKSTFLRNDEREVNAIKNNKETAHEKNNAIKEHPMVTTDDNVDINVVSETTKVSAEMVSIKTLQEMKEYSSTDLRDKVIQSSAQVNDILMVNSYMEPDSTQECHGQTDNVDELEESESLVNLEIDANEVNVEVNNNNLSVEQTEHELNKDLDECDSSQSNVINDTATLNEMSHSQLDGTFLGSDICYCLDNCAEKQECLLNEDGSAQSTEIDTVGLTVSCSDIYDKENIANNTFFQDENIQININLQELNLQNESDPCENSINVEYEEMWIDDVACVETVVSEDIIGEEIGDDSSSDSPTTVAQQQQSTEYDNVEKSKLGLNFDSTKIKNIYGVNMDTHEINLFETFYRTPYMNVQSKLNDPDHIPSKPRSSIMAPQVYNEVDEHMNVEVNVSDCNESEVNLDMVDKESSNVNKPSNVPSPGNIKEILRIKYSKCNMANSYTDSGRSKKLITKAAKKYIPPLKLSSHDLKVKLPLPEDRLETLKYLKTKQHHEPTNERSPIPKLKIRTNQFQKFHGDLKYKKKFKPKFEDVLKHIDETQYSINLSLRNRKRPVKAIPKVIIKKNENGSHYTSTPVKRIFNPDLTGNKWQPWVNLEKCMLIEKILSEGKTQAIFCHNTKQFVVSNINERKKYLVSCIGKKTQYSLDIRKKPLKCTITSNNPKSSEEYIPKSNHPKQIRRTYHPTPRQQGEC